MYAIVKVGGKQYRVEKGDSLLVDRMPEDEGAKVTLEPLLLAGGGKGDPLFRGNDLGKVSVEATVTGHERGPKIHVLKFKPKRGYKRRQGHRSELTRLEIGDIKGPGSGATKAKAAAAKPAPAKVDKAAADAEPAKDQGDKLESGAKTKASPAAKKPAAKAEPAEPVKDQGDKLEEAAETKASETADKPAAKKPAPKKPAAKKPAAKKPTSEEESDGS
jgi:large subunit ribosomal protein L21